jgi:presenilin-like A22 family membrane protease
MEHRERLVVAAVAIVGIFLAVQLGALAFVELTPEGLQETEDGGNPGLSLAFFAGILVATGVMLAALRYGGASLLRGFILLASIYISFFALNVLVPEFFRPSIAGQTVPVVSLGGSLALGLVLYAYPEWYVIDTAGVLMGIGAAGLFGVNFGILPAVVLLSVLAVYDAVSVYGTEHMLTLASGVMEMRVPVVFVVPLSLSYSFLDANPPDAVESDRDERNTASTSGQRTDADGPTAGDSTDQTAEPKAGNSTEGSAATDREALFIGLGDAIIPTVLVASAAFFLDTEPSVSLLGIPATLPAVTAMAGTLLGLVALLWFVTRGRAHAGLPLLNGGAIGGYLVGALASGLTLAEALGLTGVL